MKQFMKATAASVALALIGASSVAAQEVTLRCQHFLSPKGSVPAFFITPWAEKVEADSNGRIKVEIYPAMQLGGKPPALYDQIRDGVIDCGWALPAYTPGRFPSTEAFELPFMMTEDLLMAAVQAGGDRQELHEAIRSHSMEAAGSVKQGGPNDLLDRLRTDEQFAGLDLETLADPGLFVGRAPQQVDHFIREVVDPIATRWSAAATNQVELRV